MSDIDTSNDKLVSTNGVTLTVMLPAVNMSADEAHRLAAWLVAMAPGCDPPPTHKFDDVLQAVYNT